MKKINHIGIAVSSIEEQVPFYRDILGLQEEGKEEHKEQMVNIAVFRVGEVKIELLEPTSPESSIAKFIEKRGEGIHHIAYETEDIVQTIDTLKQKGVRLIDEEPKQGAHGTKIVFIHPKSSGKVLTELCQTDSGETGQKREGR